MAMLAGPKRKQKWTLNPRGKHWSEDSNKFGQKMLEKMGWTTGKGLGVNEQGSVEHVRVKVKNDQVGIGYNKGRDDQWTEHQDDFNNFLQNLQKEQSVDIKEIAEDHTKSLSGKSLEEKSKLSQKRVHYKKFTRGKDVNMYSAKDLANIFGKKDLNEKPIEAKTEEEEIVHDPIGAKDTTAGVLTIKGGNMNDYFSKKLSTNVQIDTSQNNEHSESESEQRVGFGFSTKCKSKFYVNDDPDKDSDPDVDKYAGFGFTKSGEAKSKCKKLNNLNYVFDNPCLDLQILDDSSPASSTKIKNNNLECSNKITPKKRKSEYSSENECINNEGADRSTSKKRKTEFIYENEALDLEVDNNDNKATHETKTIDFKYSEKLTPKKTKKVKCKTLNGYENPGLDLEFPTKSMPTKNDKKSVNKELTEINLSQDSELQENPKFKKSVKDKVTTLSTEGFDNAGLDLELSDKQTTPKSKKNKKFKDLSVISEEAEMDLKPRDKKTPKKGIKKGKEYGDTIGTYENSGFDLEFSDKLTPKSVKQDKASEGTLGIYENSAFDLEFSDKPIVNKTKKNNTNELLSNGLENPALDLSDSINDVQNTMDFEVQRPIHGVENTALDLSDENSNKKRVTFNDQIEFSTDTIKKKKKKKKLDKYEVKNAKSKKTSVSMEPATFVNEALDIEMINNEEIDNKLNERKNKRYKRNKDRRVSQLETIEEAPEEESYNTSLPLMRAEETNSNTDVEFVDKFQCEIPNDDVEACANEKSVKRKHKKKISKKMITECTVIEEEPESDLHIIKDISKVRKKKEKEIQILKSIEEVVLDDMDNNLEKENVFSSKEEIKIKCKKEKSRKKISNDDIVTLEEFLNESDQSMTKIENQTFESEVDAKESKETELQEKLQNNDVPNSFQKVKTSKQYMKSLFVKNPILLFRGSNINEIKGYGVSANTC